MNGKRQAEHKPRLSWAEREAKQVARIAAMEPERLRAYAMNYALWHVGRRALTRREVELKLRDKHVPDAVIDDTLERLEVYGGINDVEIANTVTRVKVSGSAAWSVSRVRRHLADRGVDTDVAEGAVGAVDADVEFEAALRVARKAARSSRRHTDPRKRVAAMQRALVSRGHSFDVARAAIEQVLAEEGDADAVEPDDLS